VAPVFLALLLMLPGTVFLYQGEELGLPQSDVPREACRDPEAINNWPHGSGRDGARTPMPWDGTQGAGFTSGVPWLPVDEAHRALSVALQEDDASSPLHLVRRLLALRRSLDGFGSSAVTWLPGPPTILAFDRSGAFGRLRCVFNVSPALARLDQAPRAIAIGHSSSIDEGGVQLGPRGFAIGLA
jgi:alpha-glucosidase